MPDAVDGDGDGPRSPPVVEVDDPGVRWRTVDGGLVVERRPTLFGALPIAAITAGFLAVAWFMFRDGERGMATFMLIAALFPVPVLVVRVLQRFELRLGRDGVSWQQSRPRPFQGAWPRADVNAVRVRLGEKPVRWGHRRVAYVEARVGKRWVNLGSGRRIGRVRELGDALALALGVPNESYEAPEPV